MRAKNISTGLKYFAEIAINRPIWSQCFWTNAMLFTFCQCRLICTLIGMNPQQITISGQFYKQFMLVITTLEWY